MTRTSEDGSLLRHQKVNAALFGALCVLVFHLIRNERGWAAQLLKDMLPAMIVACLVFLVIKQWLFKDELAEPKGFLRAIVDAATRRTATPVLETHHDLHKINYPARFPDATEVDVVSRPHPAWFSVNLEWLRGVLQRGGTLRVCIPGRSDTAELNATVKQLDGKVTLPALKNKITEVEALIDQLRSEGGKVELCHAGRAINLSWVRVKFGGGEHAVLWPYPHWSKSTGSPQIEVVDLNADPRRQLATYLSSEMALFVKNGLVTAPNLESAPASSQTG